MRISAHGRPAFKCRALRCVIEFIGATGPRRMEATGQASGTANFLIGPEETWRTGVPLTRWSGLPRPLPGHRCVLPGERPAYQIRIHCGAGRGSGAHPAALRGRRPSAGRKRWLAVDPRRTARAARVYPGHLPGAGWRAGAGARRIRGQRRHRELHRGRLRPLAAAGHRPGALVSHAVGRFRHGRCHVDGRRFDGRGLCRGVHFFVRLSNRQPGAEFQLAAATKYLSPS